MLTLTDHPDTSSADVAALAALGPIQVDQALGLRLIALARTASTMHMGAAFLGDHASNSAQAAQNPRVANAADAHTSAHLAASQAAALIALLNTAAGIPSGANS